MSKTPRSSRREVRNPLLSLPAARRIGELPIEARQAFAEILLELSTAARTRAEESWRKNKGPMAAYWKAVSVYAKHARALARLPPTRVVDLKQLVANLGWVSVADEARLPHVPVSLWLDGEADLAEDARVAIREATERMHSPVPGEVRR